MKILQTIYFKPHDPMTAFLADKDLKTDIYVAAEEFLETFRNVGKADAIIHEVPDDTNFTDFVIEQATKGIPERSAHDRHYDTLRFWGRAYLHRLNPGGVLATKSPAPGELTIADLEKALEDVATDPHYHHQTIILFTADGKIVRLVDGKVTK